MAREKFGGTFADTFGAFAAVEAAVVEEELEQGQVVGAEVAAEGEVVPQPAVEVLDQGTGADGALGQCVDGLVEVVETLLELLAEFGLALPAARVDVAQVLATQQFAEGSDRDLESSGEFGEIAVELLVPPVNASVGLTPGNSHVAGRYSRQ